MRLWLLGIVLLAGGIADADEAVDSTLNRMIRVDVFAFGGIGYSGVISQGEKDYREIFARPSALADFERLLALGNPQAKSYALVGIRELSQSRFMEVSRTLRDSKKEVVTQFGCIVFREKPADVLKRITKGEYPEPRRNEKLALP